MPELLYAGLHKHPSLLQLPLGLIHVSEINSFLNITLLVCSLAVPKQV
jgi:hypothetical protein